LTLGSLDVAGIATVSGDLRVKGNSMFEGIVSVIDTFRAGDLLITGVSDFFGKVIFRDHIAVGGDSAGIVVIHSGVSQINVSFTNNYDSTPLVNATLQAQGTEAQKQAILDAGYSYAITDVTSTGFTIRLNKPAASDVKFSWTAVEPGN
jgi:hypothetical protein